MKDKNNKKKKTINVKNKERKDNFFTKIINYFKEVINELKKVRWPSKSEFLKYTVATLAFMIFFAMFFVLVDSIIFGLKQLVR